MKNWKIVILGLFVGCVFAAPEEIARIGDKAITHQDLYDEMFRLYGNQTLSRMAEEAVIQQESVKRKIKAKDSETGKKISAIKTQFETEDSFQKFLAAKGLTQELLERQVKQEILKYEMVQKDMDIEVTGKEIEDYYKANREILALPERVEIAHILVSAEQEAKDILVALEAGADFGKMAQAKSIDSSSSQKGGYLGFFTQGVLIPELRTVFNYDEGRVTQPIKTALGWHIIKVIKKAPFEEVKLDKELKEKIKNALLSDKVEKAYPAWMQNLLKEWIKPIRTGASPSKDGGLSGGIKKEGD